MPVFMLTTVALLALWVARIGKTEDGVSKSLAVELLKSRHKHSQVDYSTLVPLLVVLAGMFLAWSFVPQVVLPPETIALFGYAVAALICAAKGKQLRLGIDFKAVITIAAFLFLAGVVDATGILIWIAGLLQSNISDPKMLLIVIMLMTSVMAGLFSAGPAAAAMMPVIVNLCNTSLAGFSDWVAIAYAASICAGSSLFLWSATAGFIVSSKVEEAQLGDKEHIRWGIGEYLKHGICNYAIQMAVAIGLVAVIL
jgi:di/tricarboxylate transporter